MTHLSDAFGTSGKFIKQHLASIKQRWHHIKHDDGLKKESFDAT